MGIPFAKSSNSAVQTSLSLLQDLFGSSPEYNFMVRLWDGTIWNSGPVESAQFTLVLQHPGSLKKMFLPPSDLNMGKAYIYNDFDIEGNIEAIFPIADQFINGHWGIANRLRYRRRLLSLPQTVQSHVGNEEVKLYGKLHSKERDKQAIAYHYDVSNDFYALWLDARMIYSCACFSSPDDDLDIAQERKLDYICRKLRLQRGERLLDIGCGWGGLVIYAAQHYGVEAHGITLSRLQENFAQRRIKEAGLTNRCHVNVCDYRDMSVAKTFDKIASLEMFEHVGETLLPTYFQQAYRLLRPGGVFITQGTSSGNILQPPRGPTFTQHYMLPDGERVPIGTTLQAAETGGFEVRDVESLREHYMLTQRNWVRKLEAHAEDARQLVGDVVYRIRRLYMAGVAYAFQTGRINLYQVVLVKPDQGKSCLPLIRSDWSIR